MVAFRAIVGAGVTVFIMVYVFWFVIPVTRTAYTNEIAAVNTTSSLMQTIIPIMNNWWTIFPLIIAIAGGWTIWQYATGNWPFDWNG